VCSTSVWCPFEKALIGCLDDSASYQGAHIYGRTTQQSYEASSSESRQGMSITFIFQFATRALGFATVHHVGCDRLMLSLS